MELLVLYAVKAGTSVYEDCLRHLEEGLVRALLADLAGMHIRNRRRFLIRSRQH